MKILEHTGKSLSEALIFASTNPQYDNRLYINCSESQNKNKKHFVYTICSELAILMYWTRNSMKNLSSYFGSINTKMIASDKEWPVQRWPFSIAWSCCYERSSKFIDSVWDTFCASRRATSASLKWPFSWSTFGPWRRFGSLWTH